MTPGPWHPCCWPCAPRRRARAGHPCLRPWRPAWMVQGSRRWARRRTAISSPTPASWSPTTARGVIDALGSPALAEELLAQIRRITPLPVTHVIITHYHADHIYGPQAFHMAGATVIAARRRRIPQPGDRRAAPEGEPRADLPWIDENTRLVPADRWIDGPTTLGGMEFRLQPVGPSHTPEDLVVYVPRLRALFAGDFGIPRPRCPSSARPTAAAGSRRSTACSAYDIAVWLPGHGRPRRVRAPTCSPRATTRAPVPDRRARPRNMEPLRRRMRGRLVALRQAAAVPGRQPHQSPTTPTCDGARGEVKRSRRAFLIAAAARAGLARFTYTGRAGELVRWLGGDVAARRRTLAPAAGRAQVVVFWPISCLFCKPTTPMSTSSTAPAATAFAGATVLRERRPRGGAALPRRQRLCLPVSLDYRLRFAAAGWAAPRHPCSLLVDRQGRPKQAIPGEMSRKT